MKSISFALVFALVAVASSWPWSSAPTPFWNDLKVKFGVPLIDTEPYAHMPRTVAEATTKPFNLVQINTDCTNGNTFHGYRFIFQGDYTMALLYDANGYIAGIQMILNQQQIMASGQNNFNYAAVGQFQPEVLNGQNVYTLTTYFVDPSTICSTGRLAADFASQGTGVGLYFQNGKTIDSLIVPPTNRADAISQGWTKNKCFVGMGYHNFFNVPSFEADNCSTVRPVFLLFDKNDKLKGFGYVAFGDATSIRYEKPPSLAIKAIIGSPTPTCLTTIDDLIKVSSMHVFLIDNPGSELCL